ncbi:ROK family protein [Gloeobacter morelensis]|uniref:ROK family protein n=1 Tax=Gloeobacter morelensis MG652769 TaxID=2781736 RepID=A0ABY3PNM5_9CYAN|nr:ROK family protein [Gloeobacter morelensis]UFP95215.1 ROK family protein [Gloeobacter morelensis MG652769]
MGSVVAIDLGGTAIKAGRYDGQGRELASATIATPRPSTPAAVLAALSALVAGLDPERAAVALGVGVPGLVDVGGRLVYTCINLDGWRDVPLARLLEEKTGLATVLGNDANLAGLGENWLGSASRFGHVIFITLGTGVGGSLIHNRRLFTGAHGLGGELGHLVFDPRGPRCNCGSSGCLEQFIAAPAIARRFGLDPAVLGERAAAGDPQALECWRQVGRDLGYALVGLVNLLDPEAVVIGGGVSKSCPYFLPEAEAEIDRRSIIKRPWLQLLQAELGNEAGCIGAARLAFLTFTS